MSDMITTTGRFGKSTKSEQTRQRIIDTYLDLINTKKWDKITVKELCEKVNITRGTFYQYFGDIYDLMEQIQNTLLDVIALLYDNNSQSESHSFSVNEFLDKYDYEPPKLLLCWFDFCKEHRVAMRALLHSENGNVYFEKKLKIILSKYINVMMDQDGLPRDEMRTYFVKIFTELHFLSARTWLTSNEVDFLSVNEIVSLLNTMRVGAGYLIYKKNTSSDFDKNKS